jgi:hypothetical protein
LLVSDILVLKLPFELLEACFQCRKASWISAARLTKIIQFFPHIIDHILGWRWEDDIHRMGDAATIDRHQGTSSAIGLSAQLSDNKTLQWPILIAIITHAGAISLLTIRVSFQVYEPPSRLGSSRLTQSYRTAQLW